MTAMDENQRRALEEGKTVAVKVRVELSQCSLNLAALLGEEKNAEHRSEGSR